MLDKEDRIKDPNPEVQEEIDKVEKAIAVWEFIKATAPAERGELIRGLFPSLFEKKSEDTDSALEAYLSPQEPSFGPDEFDTDDGDVGKDLNPMWDADWDDVF